MHADNTARLLLVPSRKQAVGQHSVYMQQPTGRGLSVLLDAWGTSDPQGHSAAAQPNGTQRMPITSQHTRPCCCEPTPLLSIYLLRSLAKLIQAW